MKKKAGTFWMSADVLQLLKADSEESGVSQAVLLEKAYLASRDLSEDEAERQLQVNQQAIDKLLAERGRLAARKS